MYRRLRRRRRGSALGIRFEAAARPRPL